MKVKIEIGPDWEEEEVVIRCSKMNERVWEVQNLLSDFGSGAKSLVLSKGETEYFVPQEQILFFETEGKNVIAHTAERMYEAQYRLYELEEMLPRYFMRISKSTIVNLNQIYSVTRNLTASSVVEFFESSKKVYVSRNYYKMMIDRMGEKRRSI